MPELIRLGNIYNENAGAGFAGNVWDKEGLCPTLTTMQGGGREPMIIEKTEPKLVSGLGEKVSNGGTQYYNQDRVYDSNGVAVAVATSFQPNYLVEKTEGICNTLTTQIGNLSMRSGIKIIEKDRLIQLGNCTANAKRENPNQCRVYDKDGISPCLTSMSGGNLQPMVIEKYRIRKLTPRECFRLMGVKDEDSQKMLDVNSNSQCYKQAGNSIVVQVLMAIFAQLIEK